MKAMEDLPNPSLNNLPKKKPYLSPKEHQEAKMLNA
jgi:hypothetical protein